LEDFAQSSWFIHWLRAVGQDDLVMSEWEMTVRHLCRRRIGWWGIVSRQIHSQLRRRWEDIENAEAKMRAVCAPPRPDSGQAPDRFRVEDDWSRARRLSAALARPTALDAPSVPPGKRIARDRSIDFGWTVVLLPRSLNEPRQQRQWDLSLAVAIEKSLNERSPAEIATAINALEDGKPVSEALKAKPLLEPDRWGATVPPSISYSHDPRGSGQTARP